MRYGEGIFIGYRYYDSKSMPVLFPFGHGLSYTTFAYNNPKLSADTFKDVDGVSVSVDVTNTGNVVGKEIVQVYVHDQKSALARPEKELKAFAKVELQPGETKTVTLWLGFRAFAYYHPKYKQWITENGAVDILIGASAADIRCGQTATLQTTLDLPSILDRELTVRNWLEDPRGQVVFSAAYAEMTAKMGDTFGAGLDDREKKAMDMNAFMLEMPLMSILDFQQQFLPMPAEDMVDAFLREVYGK